MTLRQIRKLLGFQFYGKGYSKKISSKRSPSKVSPGGLVAVYTDYEGNHTTPYTLVVALLFRISLTPLFRPEMVTEKYCAGLFAVSSSGKDADALIQAWRDIWSYFDGRNLIYAHIRRISRSTTWMAQKRKYISESNRGNNDSESVNWSLNLPLFHLLLRLVVKYQGSPSRFSKRLHAGIDWYADYYSCDSHGP